MDENRIKSLSQYIEYLRDKHEIGMLHALLCQAQATAFVAQELHRIGDLLEPIADRIRDQDE